MNKNSKWLLISVIGFLFFLFMLFASSGGYDLLGTRHWSVNAATSFIVFNAFGLATSIFAVILLTFRLSNSTNSNSLGLGKVFLACVLILTGVIFTFNMVPEKDKDTLFKHRETLAYTFAHEKHVNAYLYKEMYPVVWSSLGKVLKSCLAVGKDDPEIFTLVSDLNKSGQFTNIDFYPKNSTSSCVADSLSQLRFPTFQCTCNVLPVLVDLKINPTAASITDNDLNPKETNYRYVITNDLVYDKKINLIWQRCSIGQHWINGAGCEGDAKKFNFDDAQKLAYGPWRLPTKDELMSLIDQNRKVKNLQPTVDVIAFPYLDMKTPNYWSSTPFWNAHLGIGQGFDARKEDTFAVILVQNSGLPQDQIEHKAH